MKQQINKVIKILEKEYQLYKKIKKLVKSKQEAVIEKDLDSLEEIVRQEASHIEKLNELEEKRFDLIGDQKVSQLKEKIDNEDKRNKLIDVQNKLTKIIEAVQEINNTNDKLLKDALQLVNLELNALTGQKKQGTYSKGGKADSQDQKASAVINHKA